MGYTYNISYILTICKLLTISVNNLCLLLKEIAYITPYLSNLVSIEECLKNKMH